MKETYQYALYGGLGLLLAGIFIFFTFIGSASSGENQRTAPISKTTGINSITTGTTDTGDVAVELTPLGFFDGRLRVQIAVNTHSVDLSPFDLQQITTLETGGKVIKPIEAPALSGHHSSGELVFDVDKTPQKFTISIKGIPQIEERVFMW